MVGVVGSVKISICYVLNDIHCQFWARQFIIPLVMGESALIRLLNSYCREAE